MTVKRYVGHHLQEVVRQIKEELGPEAVLVSTEWRRRGLRGKLFGRPQVEIWAAGPEGANGSQPALLPPMGEIEGNATGSAGLVQEPAPAQLLETEVLALLSHFGECLQRMEARLNRLTQAVDQATAGLLPPDTETCELIDHLVTQGFAPDVARDLAAQVSGRERTPCRSPRSVVELLAENFRTTGPLQAQGAPLVVALVGPTGAGKTTTVAKLAAQCGLAGDARTMLITLDTYRLAAVEQLQAYADLMGLPLGLAQTPAEAGQLVRQARRSHDFVLIDTFGCNPRNEEQVQRLKAFVEAAEPDSVQLVLSAVAKLADLDDAMERFRPLFAGNGRGTVPNALIFSKVDETTQPGAMASVAWRHPTPVSYLTTGQNVPGDLMVAEPLRLAEMVV